MAEPDLTALARAWADRTAEPDFDALVGRAHARRRRRALSLVAAAVAVLLVAGLSTVLLQRGPSAAPMPTHHHPAQVDHTRDPSWMVAHGRVVSWAAGLGGWTSSGAPPEAPDRVLTVWQHCRHESRGCRSAWRLTDWHGKEIATGLAAGKGWNTAPTAQASGNTFVLRTWNRPGIVVSPDGSTRPVVDAAGGTLAAGDVLVRTETKGLAVTDPRSATRWNLPGPGGREVWEVGAIGSDGTAWLMPVPGRGRTLGTVALQWLRDGHWHQHVLWNEHRDTGGTPMPGLLAVSGQHVAAVSSFDGATLLPVGTFAVTTDGGTHWTDLTRRQVPFETVDSMAATSGGTLYVVGHPHGGGGPWNLFRSTDSSWTRFEQVPGGHDIAELEPGGPVVLGFSGSLEHPGLVALDDRGNRTDVPIR